MSRVHSHSVRGGDHRGNEDAFLVRPVPGGLVCVLADGQGGRAGGGRAAWLAAVTCVDLATKHPPDGLLDPATWDAVLSRTDQIVAADEEAGFTTLVAFAVVGDKLGGASCGDSAAVLLGERRILTEGQPKDPPVGSGAATFRPFSTELRPPWTLLALSDGAWKYGGWPNVLNLDPARGVEEMVTAVLDFARMPTGAWQDDCTVVAIQSAPTR